MNNEEINKEFLKDISYYNQLVKIMYLLNKSIIADKKNILKNDILLNSGFIYKKYVFGTIEHYLTCLYLQCDTILNNSIFLPLSIYDRKQINRKVLNIISTKSLLYKYEVLNEMVNNFDTKETPADTYTIQLIIIDISKFFNFDIKEFSKYFTNFINYKNDYKN